MRHDFLSNTRIEGIVERHLEERGNWLPAPWGRDPATRLFVPVGALPVPHSAKGRNPEAKFEASELVAPGGLPGLLSFVWLGADVKNVEPKELLEPRSISEQRALTRRLVRDRLAPEKAKMKGVYWNARVLARGRVRARIPLLTLLVGDKCVLSELLVRRERVSGIQVAPPPLYFSSKEAFAGLLAEPLASYLSQCTAEPEEKWALRPNRSSRGGMGQHEPGRGVRIFRGRALLAAILEELQLEAEHRAEAEAEEDEDDDEEGSKRKVTFPPGIHWVLTPFVRSFLWKLSGPAVSRRLLDLYELHPVPTKLRATEELEFMPVRKPDTLKDLEYKDTVGRLSEGRFYFALELRRHEDGFHFKAFLYDTVFFEVAGHEYEGDAQDSEDEDADMLRLVPKRSGDVFTRELGLDEVTSDRAAQLDLGFSIRKRNAKAFDEAHPLGKGTWENIVLPQLRTMLCEVVAALIGFVTVPEEPHFVAAFQHFAGDMIVDESGKPWLLEINSRPWAGFDDWWADFDPTWDHCPSVRRYVESLLSTFLDPHFPHEQMSACDAWELVDDQLLQ